MTPWTRRTPCAKAVASVVAAVIASPGCAVRTWTPEPQARVVTGTVTVAPGDSVRVTDDLGSVEIEVVAFSAPYLSGRVRPGKGRVGLELDRATSIDVLTAEGQTRKGLAPAALAAGDVVGHDVQLATPEGPAALRALALDDRRVLHGQPLACREDRREVRCTGVVRVDLRAATQVEVRRPNASASVLASAGVLAAVLGVLYGAWMAYWSGYDK
jgi:hypothetical protein